MPWCPRCDETFPEGPACPRCSARLVDRERGAMPEELQAVDDLPSIKVSRRDRRALERLSGPKAPSSRVLAFAVAALVFAVGFLVGRLGNLEPSEPSVRALPRTEPLNLPNVEGSAAYLLWTGDPLATIAVHDLYSGDVVPRARLTPPFEAKDARTRLVSLGGSVALVAADEDGSFVAFASDGNPTHGWVGGVDAAWRTTDELWVRQEDGVVTAWSAAPEGLTSKRVGRADAIYQTSRGAVLQRPGELLVVGGASHREVALPPGAKVLATNGRRVLIERDGLALWDGEQAVPVRLQGFVPIAASFEPFGDRAAVVLRRGAELSLAVLDGRGNAALKPLGARRGDCTPAASWDRSGTWIYVAPGDGRLYVVESAGGRVEHVRTKAVGCGAAWLDL